MIVFMKSHVFFEHAWSRQDIAGQHEHDSALARPDAEIVRLTAAMVSMGRKTDRVRHPFLHGFDEVSSTVYGSIV